MPIHPTAWSPWALALASLLAAILAGLLVHAVLFRVLARLARRTPWAIDDVLVARVRHPARLLLPLLVVQLARPLLWERTGLQSELAGHVLSLGLIAALAWTTISVLSAAQMVVERTHRIDVADNLEARRLQTQAVVLKRVGVAFVLAIALGAALMTFPRVRQIGTSMLASAGIVGLALGISARPVLENLIAGLQLALAQPVRLDDVVIVQGQWGRVEEITTTYVVVRIWDERRLIVPFSKFISEPFENWTRTRAELLGSVYLHVDYTVPVQALRDELRRVVADAGEWDGRVCVLQVTDASERTLELRALVSAPDASKAWDLRCKVREALVGFLQRQAPGALPRTRVAVQESEAVQPGEDVQRDEGEA